MLGDHEKDSTPCGEHSPFRKLFEVNGKIIMFGCGLGPNTSMHAIEELIEPEYLFGDTLEYKIIDGEHIIQKEYRTHNFKGYDQRYDRIERIMGDQGIRRIKVLDSETYILDCRGLWTAAEKSLREDPRFFVDSCQ